MSSVYNPPPGYKRIVIDPEQIQREMFRESEANFYRSEKASKQATAIIKGILWVLAVVVVLATSIGLNWMWYHWLLAGICR